MRLPPNDEREITPKKSNFKGKSYSWMKKWSRLTHKGINLQRIRLVKIMSDPNSHEKSVRY